MLLCDWGFAAFSRPGEYLTKPCGTQGYCAPEIQRGVPYAGAVADMYSVGVVLYGTPRLRTFKFKSADHPSHSDADRGYAIGRAQATPSCKALGGRAGTTLGTPRTRSQPAVDDAASAGVQVVAALLRGAVGLCTRREGSAAAVIFLSGCTISVQE